MFRLHPLRLNQQTLLRIFADIFLLSAALVTALFVHFIIVIITSPAQIDDLNALFWRYGAVFRDTAWLLILICLPIFHLSGFYSYGRAYRGRYKVLVVAQAVTLGFVVFSVVLYLLGGGPQLPRSAWVIAWIISLIWLTIGRLWAFLWRNVVRTEQQELTQTHSDVRNVLVIGGAGYIGSALLPKLLDEGYHVRLLDMLLYGDGPIKDVLTHRNLEIVQTDFRQVDEVVRAMRGADSVVHLGAIVGDPACALDEELTIDVNLMATRMIAEVAKGSNVNRFLFASTCSVYGAGDEILDENSGLNPVSLYARSKIGSENVLVSIADSQFAATIMRIGTVYGISGRTRFDLVANLLTAKAAVDSQITVYGGEQWRPFVHVEDVARSIVRILQADAALVANQTFNVGSDEQNYQIQQVAEIVQSLVPTSVIVQIEAASDPRNYRVDFSRIRNQLGFMPEWTMEQGVRQVIDAIESGRVVDYRDAKYSNVKYLGENGESRMARPESNWAQDMIKESDPDIPAKEAVLSTA